MAIVTIWIKWTLFCCWKDSKIKDIRRPPPKRGHSLRCYEKGREEIVGIFGEESILYGSTWLSLQRMDFVWPCFGNPSYKKMVTAVAEIKILWSDVPYELAPLLPWKKLLSFPFALSKDLHFRFKRFVAIGPLDAQLIIQMEKLESLCILFDLRHCHGELE